MRFSYKAITDKGQKVEGVADAKDQFDLAHQLKGQKKLLVSAKNAEEKGIFKNLSNFSFSLGIGIQEKIIFARNLSAMVHAGLSISRALSILERQTKNVKFQKTIRAIAEAIKGGESLSTGLGHFPKVFSPLFVSMVRAGEESGSLAETLKIIGEQMQKTYTLQRKIKGALLYPAIIIIAMIVIGIIMLIFVVPTLTSTFKELGVELPTSTKAVIFVSDFLVAHTVTALGVIALAVASIVLFFRTRRGKRILDFSLLRIPIIGTLVRKNSAARTARTLSSLLSSGVDIIEALKITTDVMQNVYYKEIIARATEQIQKGSPLSRSFKEGGNLYPILLGEMMEVGEETGTLSGMLLEIATFYEEEVEESTKNMATIVEPFLMVLVGTVVGFFAISMISPTYSLVNNI